MHTSLLIGSLPVGVEIDNVAASHVVWLQKYIFSLGTYVSLRSLDSAPAGQGTDVSSDSQSDIHKFWGYRETNYEAGIRGADDRYRVPPAEDCHDFL